MPFTDTLPFLRQVTAFSLLDDEELDRLSAELQVHHFSIGQTICRAGDPADSLYLVYTGRARVLHSGPEGETTLGTLSRGDHFGEGALLAGEPREHTVRAAEDTV